MKRILFALIASAALFSFISCDNDSKPSEQPPNSFSGKTFIGSYKGYLMSYIEFTSNTECKVYFTDANMTEPVPVTYQVSDDIATLKGTGDYKDLELKTSKLTGGKFTLVVPAEITGGQDDLTVSYVVGNKNVFDEWEVWYNGNPVKENGETFTLIYGELEERAKELKLEETKDYTLDEAKKRVVLTQSGYEKVQPDSSDQSPSDPESQPENEMWAVYYGDTPIDGLTGTYAELEAMAKELGLEPDTHYTLDKTKRRILLTESGFQKATGTPQN
ncbi:MAG: hypothetical protein IJX45_09325 [Spirochaetaceae bacterium]|nr:hypothetical protein [Spirochaetaceae bacterium]MBQ8560964.1 hypothetical protein [Spirochaetaceae bacterium]